MTETRFEFEAAFKVTFDDGKTYDDVRVMGGYDTEREAAGAMRRMIKAWTGDQRELTLISASVRPEL